MKMTRYEKTVRACALHVDIDALPYGDMTEIGERGVTLSGGQKQRINIARAIYADRDIILMDDPLSSVDAHVGQHIFDHAIRGMLANKCRILATHQLHVLSSCDRVVCMENGRIKTVDTYDNLTIRDDRLGRYLLERVSASTEKQAESGDVAKTDGPNASKTVGQIKTSAVAEPLMQDESKTVSSISWKVYAAYARASGTIFNALWILILLVLFRAANLMVNLWLAYWVSDDFPLQREQYVRPIPALLLPSFFASLTTPVTLPDWNLRRPERSPIADPVLLLPQRQYDGHAREQEHAQHGRSTTAPCADGVFRHHAAGTHLTSLVQGYRHHRQ